MQQKVTPIGNRLLIQRIEVEDKTPGGIVLPDVAKRKPKKGKVIAAGPGATHHETGKLIPMEIKVGNIVLFTEYAGNEIKVLDKDFVIMREDDILAVVEE